MHNKSHGLLFIMLIFNFPAHFSLPVRCNLWKELKTVNIEKEYDNIFRYALCRTGNRHDAEDITQEAYLRYLQHEEYHNGKERQILYTIVRNLCIDLHRRPKSAPEEDIPSDEDIPQKVALRLAMSKLSDEDREIVILRFVNEEKISDIARLFNTSRFTMSRRIKDIVSRLKNELKGVI